MSARTQELLDTPRPENGTDDLLGGSQSDGLLGDDLLGDGLEADGLLDDSDDLLGDSDNLLGDDDEDGALGSMGPKEGDKIKGSGKEKKDDTPAGLDPHAEVFANDQYPSAIKCAKCHQRIYDEWRVSAHAYASISPMFQKFEQAINSLSQGTVGTFCMRCHAPVATQLDFPRDASIVDAPYVFREGVTCVACHRVVEPYGRVHGERRVEPGPLQAPVYGGIGGEWSREGHRRERHLQDQTGSQ